ncbi:EEF1A lysine methyltransferase 2 [Neodiprion virginianus]|uniref:EEF1A lysine methyltransferase 2 n=1 Tax=Neodiprion virginianus TaxID=2961670 RepID=UPI001EE69EC2|nr:EEF1A lysine methyltransferase 2 [Neodiprion virginianus]XP_046626398.1 EEF1A lysine methyltransferase 2 [Neodiprion virginianus]
MAEDEQELDSSELGTQDYWDKTYSLEINNFKHHGDVGEVWFGEDSALRIVRWLSTKPELVASTDRIIDLGCGNGMMLVELHDEGFTNLTGVDYSQNAIDLASQVLRDKSCSHITLQTFDILENDIADLGSTFRVAHDKGTYDAVSLNPDNPKEKREKYIKNVKEMLDPQGILIITSCNWTEDELINHFKIYFELLHSIPTPSFRFAGQTGNLISSLVFRKR